jgi:hypothetical protein
VRVVVKIEEFGNEILGETPPKSNGRPFRSDSCRRTAASGSFQFLGAGAWFCSFGGSGTEENIRHLRIV